MRWTPRCFFWDFTVPVLWWQNFWWQNGRIIAEMLRFLKPVMKRKNHWNMVIKSLNNWNIDALSQWWVENTIDILMWLFSDEWKEPLIYRRTSQWWKEKELSKHFDYFFCDQPTKQTNEKKRQKVAEWEMAKIELCMNWVCLLYLHLVSVVLASLTINERNTIWPLEGWAPPLYRAYAYNAWDPFDIQSGSAGL